MECPTRGFPSPCAPGKGFPGLEQDLLASEDGIPCPPCPLIPWPLWAPCPSDEGSPQVLLHASLLPHACNLPCAQGVRGAAEAVGGHRSVSCHGYSSTHTWVLREAWEGGTGSTRSWVFISRVETKSSEGRFLGDGSGMFHAVALPTRALMRGSGDPALPSAPHWDGREGEGAPGHSES